MRAPERRNAKKFLSQQTIVLDMANIITIWRRLLDRHKMSELKFESAGDPFPLFRDIWLGPGICRKTL